MSIGKQLNSFDSEAGIGDPTAILGFKWKRTVASTVNFTNYAIKTNKFYASRCLCNYSNVFC